MEHQSSDEDLRNGSLLSSDDEPCSVTLFQDRKVAKLENNKRKGKRNSNGKETKSSESSGDEEAKKLLDSETSLKLQTDEEAKRLLGSETSLKLQTDDEEAKKQLGSETSLKLQTRQLTEEELKIIKSFVSIPGNSEIPVDVADNHEADYQKDSKSIDHEGINDQPTSNDDGDFPQALAEEQTETADDTEDPFTQIDSSKEQPDTGNRIEVEKEGDCSNKLKRENIENSQESDRKDCNSTGDSLKESKEIKDTDSVEMTENNQLGMTNKQTEVKAHEDHCGSEGDFSKEQKAVEPEGEMEEDVTVSLSNKIETEAVERLLSKVANYCETKIKGTNKSVTREPIGEFGKDISLQGLKSETVEIHEETREVHCPSEKNLTNEQKIAELKTVMKDISILIEAYENKETEIFQESRDKCDSKRDSSKEQETVESKVTVENFVSVLREISLDLEDEIRRKELEDRCNSRIDSSKQKRLVGPMGEIGQDVTVPLGIRNESEEFKSPKKAHDDDCYSEGSSAEEERKTMEEFRKNVSRLVLEEIRKNMSRLVLKEDTDAIKEAHEVNSDSKGDSEKEYKLIVTMGEIGNDAAIPLTLEINHSKGVILCEKCSSPMINMIDASESIGNTQKVNEESNTCQDKSSKEYFISRPFHEVVNSFKSQNRSFLRSNPVTYDPYEGLLRDYASPPSELTGETDESPREGGGVFRDSETLTDRERTFHTEQRIRSSSFDNSVDLRNEGSSISQKSSKKHFVPHALIEGVKSRRVINTSVLEDESDMHIDWELWELLKKNKDLGRPITDFSPKPDDPQPSVKFPFPEINDSPNSSKKSDADEIQKLSSVPGMSYETVSDFDQRLSAYMESLKAWGDIKIPIVEFPSESDDSRPFSEIKEYLKLSGKSESDGTRESTGQTVSEQCTADEPQVLEHIYSRRYVQMSSADLRSLRENSLAILTSSRDEVSQFSSSVMGNDDSFVGRCVRTLARFALGTLAKFTEVMMEKVKNDIKFYDI